jgi:hypothetical protein
VRVGRVFLSYQRSPICTKNAPAYRSAFPSAKQLDESAPHASNIT